MYRRYLFFYFSAMMFLTGCSTTRLVPEGDALYTGASIKFQTDEDKKYQKRLANDLDNLIKPKPNKTLLGFPVKLAIYTAMGDPSKTKGIKAAIRRKLGEPPVLFSTVNPDFTKNVLQNALFNKGYFHSVSSYTVDLKGKKTSVTYLLNTGPSYKVKEYLVNTTNTRMDSIILGAKSKPLLKAKRRYNLDRIRAERERIDKELKDNGYYFFNSDFLLMEVDSLEKTKEVNLRIRLKENLPPKAVRQYSIRKSLVMMDSTYVMDSTLFTSDTLFIDSVHINVSKSFKPKPIVRYVFLRKGALYSREKHQLTISRLMGMGLFRYANMDIREVDSTGLANTIHLAPLKKKSVSIEIQAVTKSNNFVGPRMNVYYLNRNIFRGGERFTANFHGSVETQLNGQFQGLYTYEVGPQLQLSIPHFIVPFKIKPSNLYTPATIIMADYNFTRRVNYFDLRSLKVDFKYKWRETMTKDHEFAPLSINIFSIKNPSDSFNRLVERNPSLRRRYDDQLIAGMYYSFTYNEQTISGKRDQLYLNANADIAGTTVSLLGNVLGTGMKEGVKTFAGIVYGQFIRLDADFRNYYHINRKSQLVTRVYTGWGIPFGNSSALPYIKSFFSGGTNSVRAFNVNSLGPGTYRLPDSVQALYFLQQGGDIKLEFNIEYRFPIISVLKGALFTDAGNTWLARSNPSVPGGEFKKERILKELGIGAGFGFRVDLSFFVIRLDIATPLRKPWLQQQERWVLSQFNPGSKEWRKNNLLFNIGIGYPF